MTADRTFETIADAAGRHKVSASSIRRRIAEGVIPAYRHGQRLIRLDVAEVDDALLRPIPTGTYSATCLYCSDRRADMRAVVRQIENAEPQGRPTAPYLAKIAALKQRVATHANCPEKNA